MITGQWGGVYRSTAPTHMLAKGVGQGGYITGKCGKDNPGAGGAGGGGSKVWYNDKILQAGGGGGAGERGTHMTGGAGGGAKKGGGGLNGGNGVTNNNGDLAWTGHGGTTTGPGLGYTDENRTWCSSGFDERGGYTTYKAEKNWWCGGAGGGGYYGGSGGSPGTEAESAGGGGSGYSAGFDNIDGASGVQIANGLVRICWGSDTNCNGGSNSGKVSKCEGSTYAVNKDSNILYVSYGSDSRWITQTHRYGTELTGGCSTTTFGDDPAKKVEKHCCMPGGFSYMFEKTDGSLHIY